MSETKRSFPLWLSVSVLINILLVGMIAGYLIGNRGGPPADGREEPAAGLRSELALGRGILEVTPRSERRLLAREFRRTFAEGGGQFRDRLETRREILQALEAETFDPAAIETALDTLQAADVRLQDGFHAQLVEALTELTPEERRELAALIREEAENWARRRPVGRGQPHGPPPR